jgi:hypothetical protein
MDYSLVYPKTMENIKLVKYCISGKTSSILKLDIINFKCWYGNDTPVSLLLKHAKKSNEDEVLQCIKLFINNRVDQNRPSDNKHHGTLSLLTLASFARLWNVVGFLVNNKARTYGTIYELLDVKKFDIVQRLCSEFRVRISSENYEHFMGDLEVLAFLWDRKVLSGVKSLHKAIEMGEIETLKLILGYLQEKETTAEISEMINTPTEPYFETAIEVCCKMDILNIEAAKYLLSLGADPNLPLRGLTTRIVTEGMICKIVEITKEEWLQGSAEIQKRKSLVLLMLDYGGNDDLGQFPIL